MRTTLALTLFIVNSVAGCYNAEQLIESASAEVRRARLEEVDLGKFSTTMPSNPNTTQGTEVRFRIFGNAPRYRVEKINQALESRGYRLRYETLAAVREATPQELVEPDLATLRQRITTVVNSVLGDTPVESIGFADVRFVEF